MKNLFKNLLLAIGVVAFLASCGPSGSKGIQKSEDENSNFIQELSDTAKKTVEKKPVPLTTYWIAKANLSTTELEGLWVFNSEEITLSTRATHTSHSVDGGVLKVKDETKPAIEKITRLTFGRIKGFIYDKDTKDLIQVFVSFSKRTEVCRVYFNVKPDGEIVLNGGRGERIKRNGEWWQVYSSSNRKNKLLFFVDYQSDIEKVLENHAEGDQLQ